MDRARHFLQRALGLFPITATGFVLLAGSFIALYLVGMRHIDRVLIVVGMAGVLLFAISLLLTIAGSLTAALQLRVTASPPLRLVVGHLGVTGFVYRSPWWLPLLDVRWTVTTPDVAVKLVPRGRSLHEHWIPARRGTPSTIERWFTVGDGFGICSITFPVHTEGDLHFLPDEGSLRRVEVIQGLASGDQIAHPDGRPEGDLQDMRQYGAGDPIRYVLWKVFAKSRTLVVRTPERALSPITRTAAYLVVAPDDQAAAGTAKTAIECGALGREWVFGADGTSAVARKRQEALPILLDSGDHPVNEGGSGLRTFLDTADAPRRIVIFAPPTPGPWVQAVLGLAQHTAIELVLCADHITPAPSRFDVRKVVLLPPPPPKPGTVTVDRSTLARLCRSLAGVGDLRIVDRQAGVVYAGTHITKLTRGAA